MFIETLGNEEHAKFMGILFQIQQDITQIQQLAHLSRMHLPDAPDQS